MLRWNIATRGGVAALNTVFGDEDFAWLGSDLFHTRADRGLFWLLRLGWHGGEYGQGSLPHFLGDVGDQFHRARGSRQIGVVT